MFDFNFNNMGRISLDSTDQSQKNVYNTRFANYTLSNYFSNIVSDNHVKFAIEQPTTTFNELVGLMVENDLRLESSSRTN
jgi:hypothetical protein